MELNILIIGLSTLSIILLGATVFTLVQYKAKKTEGLTLEGKLSKLKRDIEAAQAQLEQIRNQDIEAAKAQLEQLKKEYQEKKASMQELFDLEKRETELRTSERKLQASISKLKNDIEERGNERKELQSEIASIKNDISIFSPTLDWITVGFFEEPEYLFETSERFKEEIKTNREKQKQMINKYKALQVPSTVAITDNTTHAKKILRGQAKLMLKAFNVECDNLMASIKPSNFANILERIDKVAADIEKTSISLECGFSQEYIKLKFEECELQYQFKLKQQREREEQKRIKDQMREEQQAIRDFERALAKARKEEEMYQDALEQAKKELEIAADEEKEKLEERVRFLQGKLQEAMEQEKRAQSMAEQTKRGHVYIISNIGSFGEDVYKIGLTRRLEPIDRVKELGDASVPFSFDIHALIYSEDAPNLEYQLHQEFSTNRLNAVNQRKEFFNVSLEEIRKRVEEIAGDDAEFKMTALAEEYHESRKLREELS